MTDKKNGEFDLRKLFSRKHAVQEHDGEFTLSFNQAIAFFRTYGIIFLLLIPLFTSYYLRTVSMDLPITDMWAKNSVDRYYRSQIEAQIEQQYPNLPSNVKSAQVQKEFEKFLSSNQEMYEQQVKQASQQFKAHFQDETGGTYVGDIDTYYYLKRSEWFIQNGYVGNTLVDGKPYDTYTLAPVGEFTDRNLLYYLVAITYKVMRLFDADVTARTAFSYLPVFFSMLGVIPVFFIGRRAGGDLSGFFAAMLFAVHPNFLTRTIGAASDTDVYTVTLPLFALWLFIEAVEANTRQKSVLFAISSSFFLGLFAFAWEGWWYIFDFILISIIGYVIYRTIHRMLNKEPVAAYFTSRPFLDLALVTLVFIAATGIMVSAFASFSDFKEAPLGPLQIFTLKVSTKASLWPNVYTTVAELNEASIGTIIDSIGKFPFVLSLLGIILTLARRDHPNLLLIIGTLAWSLLLAYRFYTLPALVFAMLIGVPVLFGAVLSLLKRYEVDIKLAAILIVWYVGLIYASTKGIRFTMLLVPPFAIGYGITIGKIYSTVTHWMTEELHVPAKVGKPVLVLASLFLLITPVKAGYAVAERSIPLINDAWWTALEKIKGETPQNAIITSWWDYGHWFKYVADRPVTFDGGNQNVPQAHWVGKMLLTWDEKEALGILRMLDCGASLAGELIDEQFMDTAKTVALLNQLVKSNRVDARRFLMDAGFEQAKTDVILQKTHCIPPPAIVITSEDMISKAGVWAHFGSWDFNKAKMWLEVKDMQKVDALQYLQTEFNMTQSEAERTYQEIRSIANEGDANNWIAPWPSYAGGFAECEQDNATLSCPISVRGGTAALNIDLKTMDAWVMAGDNKKVHPNSLAFASADAFNVKVYEEDTFGISVGLLQDKERNAYYSIMLAPQLSASLFTRLFFFNAYGTQYLTQFTRERDISGSDIIVWNVHWDKYLEDIGDA